MSVYDLLKMVEAGGCSAKLPARELEKALADLPRGFHPDLLVDTTTHDDAGVFKLSSELALILTTDFFPPVCSDPYDFGQIAAANALSDVYAMGGEALTALNLVMFPATAPMEVLKEILRGGNDKVIESGGVIAGGHTIVDDIPKYGLAITGRIHPDKIITNAAAEPGDVLLLTKAIGGGIMLAGKKLGVVTVAEQEEVLSSMKQLNREGARIMQHYGVRCATDITGFGLLGHALKMAQASGVTLNIRAKEVPRFSHVDELLELGCIPGACFRNLEYVEASCRFAEGLSYEKKMLMLDAQTSGGLLICCRPEEAEAMISDLVEAGYSYTCRIGEAVQGGGVSLAITWE